MRQKAFDGTGISADLKGREKNMEQTIFWGIWGVLGSMMFLYYMRRVHKIRSFLAGACSGLLALLLVHYAGTWIGYSPALNLLHVLQAGILGVPGVILMVVLHFTI